MIMSVFISRTKPLITDILWEFHKIQVSHKVRGFCSCLEVQNTQNPQWHLFQKKTLSNILFKTKVFTKNNLEVFVTLTLHRFLCVFVHSFSPDIGHYTAMLQTNTHRLGCGFGAFLSPDTDALYSKHFVCNYGPAGNRLGAFMHKVGQAGAACEKQDTAYPALCTS
jgi:hypothetical protein